MAQRGPGRGNVIKGSTQRKSRPTAPGLRIFDEPARRYAKPWLNRNKTESEEYQYVPNLCSPRPKSTRPKSTRPKSTRPKSIRKKVAETTSDLALRLTQEKQAHVQDGVHDPNPASTSIEEKRITDHPLDLECEQVDEVCNSGIVLNPPQMIGTRLSIQIKPIIQHKRPKYVLTPGRHYPKPWLKYKDDQSSSIDGNANTGPAIEQPTADQNQPLNEGATYATRTLRDPQGNTEIVSIPIGARTDYQYDNNAAGMVQSQFPEQMLYDNYHSSTRMNNSNFDHVEEGLSFGSAVTTMASSKQNVTFYNYNFEPFFDPIQVPLRKKTTFGSTVTKTFQNDPKPSKSTKRKPKKQPEAEAQPVTIQNSTDRVEREKGYVADPVISSRGSRAVNAPKVLTNAPALPRGTTSTKPRAKQPKVMQAAPPSEVLPEVQLPRPSPRTPAIRNPPKAIATAANTDPNAVNHTTIHKTRSSKKTRSKPAVPLSTNSRTVPTKKPSIVPKSRLSLKTSFISNGNNLGKPTPKPRPRRRRPEKIRGLTPPQILKYRPRSKSGSVSPHSQLFGRQQTVRSQSKRQYLNPDSVTMHQTLTDSNLQTITTDTTLQPGSIATTTEDSDDDSSLERAPSTQTLRKWCRGISSEMLDQGKKPIELQPRKGQRKVRRSEREEEDEAALQRESDRILPSTDTSRNQTPRIQQRKKLTKTQSKSKNLRSKTKSAVPSKNVTPNKRLPTGFPTSNRSVHNNSEKSIQQLFGRATSFNTDDSEEPDSSIAEELEDVEELDLQDDFIAEDLEDDGSLHSTSDTESAQTTRPSSKSAGERERRLKAYVEEEPESVDEVPDFTDEDIDYDEKDEKQVIEICTACELVLSSGSFLEKDVASTWHLPNTDSFTLVSNEHGQRVRLYADGTSQTVKETMIYPSTRKSPVYKAGMKRQILGSEERDSREPTHFPPPPTAFSGSHPTATNNGRMFYDDRSNNGVVFVPNIMDYPVTQLPAPLSFEPPRTSIQNSQECQSHWEYLDGGMGAHHQPLPPPPTFQQRIQESDIQRQVNSRNRCWTHQEIPDMIGTSSFQATPRRVFQNPVLSYDLPTYDEFRTSQFMLPTGESSYPPSTPLQIQEPFYYQAPLARRPQYNYPYPERRFYEEEETKQPTTRAYDYPYPERGMFGNPEAKQQPRTRGLPPAPARPNYENFSRPDPGALNPPIGAPELRHHRLHREPKLKQGSSNKTSLEFLANSYQDTPPVVFQQLNQEQLHYNVNVQAYSNPFQIPFSSNRDPSAYESFVFFHEPYNYTTDQNFYDFGQQRQENFNTQAYNYTNPTDPPVSHYPGLMKDISATCEVMEDLVFFNQHERTSRPPTIGDSTSVADSGDLISFEKSDVDEEWYVTDVPVRATESRSLPNTASTWRNEGCKREDFAEILDVLAPMNKRVSRDILPTKYSTGNIPPPAQSPASPDSSNASVRVLVSRRSAVTARKITFNNCPCYACRKAAGFRLTQSRSLTMIDEPNYVRKNMKDVKNYAKPVPAVATHVVDHPKGDRVAPMIFYAGRKGFGKVPLYIRKRKEILENESRCREEELQKLEVEQAKERKKLELIRRQERRTEFTRKKALEVRIAQHKKNLGILTKFDNNNNNISLPPPIPSLRSYANANIFIGPYHPSVEYLDKELELSVISKASNMNLLNSISNCNMSQLGICEIFQEPAEELPVKVLKSRSSITLKPKDSTSSKTSARDNDILEWLRKNSQESIACIRKNEMTDDEIFFNLAPSYLLRRGTSSAPGRIVPPVINPRLSQHHYYNHPPRLCRLPNIEHLQLQKVQSTPDAPAISQERN